MCALGGSNIGQKGRRRLIKILPCRQTHLGDFFGQPFEGNTFLKNALTKKTPTWCLHVVSKAMILLTELSKPPHMKNI